MKPENLNLLSDEALLTKTKALAMESHRITAELLRHIAVVDQRLLYASLCYPTLFEYVRAELGFQGASAQRRIDAARVGHDMPEIHAKIATGTLCMTNVANAKKFFNLESKNDNPLSTKQKKEIVESLEGKSTRAAEKHLASISSKPIEFLARDSIKVINDQYSEVKFTATNELIEQLTELRNLLSHVNPSMKLNDLFLKMAEISLKKLKSTRFAEKQNNAKVAQTETETETETETTASHLSTALPSVSLATSGAGIVRQSASSSRFVSAVVRRAVFARDGRQCTFRDQASGRRCGSSFQLELDHIKEFALGGENTVENLRVRCRTHNKLHAFQTFGEEKMKQFFKSRRG